MCLVTFLSTPKWFDIDNKCMKFPIKQKQSFFNVLHGKEGLGTFIIHFALNKVTPKSTIWIMKL